MMARVPLGLFPYNVHPEPAMFFHSRNALLNVETVNVHPFPAIVKST
jgi:hypothetical protein